MADNDKKIDATEGMTTYQKLMAGVGMGMVGAAMWAGNKVGLVSDERMAEKARLDVDLNNTTEGKIGNAVGMTAAAVGTAAAVAAGGMATVSAGRAVVSGGQAIAQVARVAPQAVSKAVQSARLNVALAKEMPGMAARVVAEKSVSAAGTAVKAAGSMAKTAGVATASYMAVDAGLNGASAVLQEAGLGDAHAQMAGGAAAVAVAVVGARSKLAKTAIGTVANYVGKTKMGQAAVAAGSALGVTAGVVGVDHIGTPLAQDLARAAVEDDNPTATRVAAAAREIKANAPVLDQTLSALSNAYVAFHDELPKAAERYEARLAAKQAEVEKLAAATAVDTEPPIMISLPELLDEQPAQAAQPAQIRPTAQFNQQQKVAVAQVKHSMSDEPVAALPQAAPEMQALAVQTKLETGAEVETDILARALAQVHGQPAAPQSAQPAQVVQKATNGPSAT